MNKSLTPVEEVGGLEEAKSVERYLLKTEGGEMADAARFARESFEYTLGRAEAAEYALTQAEGLLREAMNSTRDGWADRKLTERIQTYLDSRKGEK